MMILVFLFAYLASCWNILGGLAGQHSFGHAMFFGIGAYTSTLLSLNLGVTPWLGMWVGALLAGAVGLFVGYISFRYRVKGVFFLMITIAFAEIFKVIALSSDALGGAAGINIPYRESLWGFQFGGKVAYYYIALAMVLGVVVVVQRLKNVRTGYYFTAIRDNEEAAKALGINAFRYKLMATGISAALTALGGTFYAQYFFYIDPMTVFGVHLSVEMLIFAVVGGEGTVLGPVVGALILVPIAETLRAHLGGGFGGVHLIGYAVLLIVAVTYMPQGIVGAFQRQRG
jgi:branched-chain amino acid transport system permease protein